ncbi:MAG: bile acid:sodium symporter family protein [Sedimentisphaerales bacterium]|nr:bile acid:sodium symporter family protein [Sedimentisphaerales bacterium]
MINKALRFYTKYLAVWVLAMGVVAYFWPGPFIWAKPGMEWFFGLTMFGIGVVLRIEDFKQIALKPLIVLVGVCGQFLIMPFGAFAIAKLFHLPPEVAVGLILTGCAPGAMTSNVMCYIAKADAAYSVSLTTVATLLCPLLTPGLTFLLAKAQMDVPFLAMFLSVIKMVVLPLLAGFGVRFILKERIEKIIEVFPAISTTFIVFICSLVIALNKDSLLMLTLPIFAAVLVLNLYGTGAGYALGTVWRMTVPRRRTLAIEIGMQNAGLGVVLALKHFGPTAAAPAAVFVFVCIITASILASFWQRS